MSELPSDNGPQEASDHDHVPHALGRPHTDFIQVQTVPERALPAGASKPFTRGKPLSFNAAGNRAVSQVIAFPAGWTHSGRHYIDSEEEFYVLAGSIVLEGISYAAGTYGCLPAGFLRESQASPEGALVLFFYDGPHRAVYDEPPAGMYQASRLIQPIAAEEMQWVPGTADDRLAWGSSAQRKLLRLDSQNGEEAFLLRVSPDAPDTVGTPVIHDNVQELFVLSGEISTPRGTLLPGAYAWRTPAIASGPCATRSGFTAFIRSPGGALNTRPAGPAAPVDWSAPYQPLVAREQRDWAFSDFAGEKLF